MADAQPAGWSGRLGQRVEQFLFSPAFLVVLLAVGVIARLRQYLSVQSYWYDEAFQVLLLRQRSYGEMLGPQPYDQILPPVILWLGRALYDVGGDGELVMRLPAFIAGLVSLWVMVPLARAVIGSPHALWPVAWLAVCRMALTHGSEAHPYTSDMAVSLTLLWCAAVVLTRPNGERPPRWAVGGLGLGAAVGMWVSFPAAFALAGVSAGLAVKLLRSGTRRGWLAWVGFNLLTAASGAALWWLSARHHYHPNTVTQWGHTGWGGFPNWNSAADTFTWLVTRPVEVGNYGNREMGIVLTLLAGIGVMSLARRSLPFLALLLTPFALTVFAALLGKYPLAHRTGFFLLPCLWLLAGEGVRANVSWWERRGWRAASLALVFVAWDAIWLAIRVVHPVEWDDYRGAYRYMHEHRQPGDLVWSQMAVVHDVYYGIGTEPLMGLNFDPAVERMKGRRVWLVVSKHRGDWRERLAAEGEMTIRQRVTGLDVILVEPKAAP
jgi:hypothetical protein